jgi:Class II Aldolase and Adducin N-terminal domain
VLVSETAENFRELVRYAHRLSDDEKGEAQVFCDRLFQAFGHEGYKEAGATLEFRVRGKGRRTRFADLLWPHSFAPLTAFALTHKPLPCAYEALLRFGVADLILVTAWAPRGSEESVANIVEQVEGHPNAPAVLLGNHRLLAFHENPIQTARLIMVMEEAAEMTLEARELGGEKPFPTGALEREREQMARFESPS